MPDNILTEEMKARIGTTFEPVIHEVEKGSARRFAQAVENPNPLYSDDEYARKTRHGGIVCPPGFFGWPAGESAGLDRLLNILGRSLQNMLNAGNECEFFRPVRPGDILVGSGKILDMQQRKGSSGNLIFVTMETAYKNQADQLVARMRYNFVFY